MISSTEELKKLRIALVTAWFPPTNGVAVNRMKSFAKYLREDHIVDVFTLGEADEVQTSPDGNVHYLASKSILQSIKHRSGDAKLIHHGKTVLNVLADKLDLSELSDWKKRVISSLETAHEAHPYDIVLSSYAPVEAHDIALALKMKYPSLKWIADMRDEMSHNPFFSGRSSERLALKEAEYVPYVDALTTVSEPILEDFKTIFTSTEFFEEVRNGFDHDLKAISLNNSTFTMVFAGTFYGKLKPDHFLKVLSSLVQEKRINQDILINFVGTHHNFQIPNNLVSLIEFVPRLPYVDAVDQMRNADCNLLFCPPFEAKGRFTGKLFDYLSVERPILAMVDKEDVGAELVLEHKAGQVADFYDEAEIKEAFCKIYDDWKNKVEFKADSSKTSSLHRSHQVRKLNALILKMFAS
jgi:glycosyltransferase involved in cell wall biosynthesis